jgi:hypothetical protein
MKVKLKVGEIQIFLLPQLKLLREIVLARQELELMIVELEFFLPLGNIFLK